MSTTAPAAHTPPSAVPADPAESLFEPTGNLEKDYCAYCEIDSIPERDEILDSISIEERPNDEHKVRTKLFVRNLEGPLTNRDMTPLANAIPHCPILFTVRFTNVGFTENSYKLLVEAVYRSPSIFGVAVDFNRPLKKDPTVLKNQGKEYMLWPVHARGGHVQNVPEESSANDKKDPKKVAKPAPKSSAPASAAPDAVRSPIPIPAGWHALLLTAVQDISLRGNSINDKQAELLAVHCEQHSELVSLNLWGNVITDAGITPFVSMLRKNRRLTSLNLGANKLTNTGAIALVNTLLTTDVTPEEAANIRNMVKVFYPFQMSDEIPQYPTYAELRGFAAEPVDLKKDAKKPPAKKGAPGIDQAVERPKTPWDIDCIKLDKMGKVRIPGNQTLWNLNLSGNPLINDEAVEAAISVLAQRQPSCEDPRMTEDCPPHYVLPGALEYLHLGGELVSHEASVRLQEALVQFGFMSSTKVEDSMRVDGAELEKSGTLRNTSTK